MTMATDGAATCSSVSAYDYDVLIVGGGPAAASAIGTCSFLRKRTCVVEPRGRVLPTPTGTVSKALRLLGAERQQSSRGGGGGGGAAVLH